MRDVVEAAATEVRVGVPAPHAPQEISGPETQEALLFLANHCKDTGSLAEAQQYCSRLLDFGGQEKEEAKALLRDIKSRFSQQTIN